MAKNDVGNESSLLKPSAASNVITVADEKEFLINSIFHGDLISYKKFNSMYMIYQSNDALIPLTSIIYTPNRRFFENSKFFKQINNSKSLAWLKKHNILVLVYGMTAIMDYTLQSQETFNNSMLISDISQTNGCIDMPQDCIPNIFSGDNDSPNSNNDMINLLRFENSPFNYRLNTINNRIKNIYVSNYDPINVLLFNDLNSDRCIDKFIKNTININLSF